MPQETQPGDLRSLSRMIDMKIPLPYILTIIGGLAAAFATMFFQLGQVRDDMSDIKLKVNAATKVQEELAVLKFRVDTLERNTSHQGSNGRGP